MLQNSVSSISIAGKNNPPFNTPPNRMLPVSCRENPHMGKFPRINESFPLWTKSIKSANHNLSSRLFKTQHIRVFIRVFMMKHPCVFSCFRKRLWSGPLIQVSRNPGLIEMPDGKNTQSNGKAPDITRLIRSVQRLEGDPDCFGTATGACDRTDCLWREYCLKETRKDEK